MEREITFWSVTDEEILTHIDMDEAIESYLDGLYLNEGDKWPEKIGVTAYTKMIMSRSDMPGAEDVVADALMNLDEQYGNPEDAMDVTPKMKDFFC